MGTGLGTVGSNARPQLIIAVTLMALLAPVVLAAPAQGIEPEEATVPEPAPDARPATWMSDLREHIGHMPINQLSLPATHDSATDRFDPSLGLSPESYGVGETVAGILNDVPAGLIRTAVAEVIYDIAIPIAGKWGRAQSRPVDQQLRDGIRVLDLRFCVPPAGEPEPRICHGLYGVEASVVADQIRRFVISHPDEIVLVDITNLNLSQLDAAGQDGLRKIMLGALAFDDGTSMLIDPSLTPSATLDQLWAERGRIILIADNGQPFLTNDTSAQIWSDITIESEYREENDTWQEQREFAFGLLANRCGDASASNGCPDVPKDFANISAAISPSMDGIGGAIVQDVKDELTVGVGPFCLPAPLCNALDLIAFAFFVPDPAARNLEELAKLGNANITNQLEGHVLQTGGRPNLNIVAADFYEASDLVPTMIRLNTPPTSNVTIGIPRHMGDADGPTFITSQTPITHRAHTRHYGFVAHAGGLTRTITRTGSASAVSATSTGDGGFTHGADFQVTGADGAYTVETYATNRALVSDRVHLRQVYVDNTAPVITVTEPRATRYTATTTLNLDYDVTDGEGSGINSTEPTTLRGSTTLGGTRLDSGRAIDLLTEMPLGTHAFTVGGSVDNLGNTRAAVSTTFEIIVTPESILEAVDIFAERDEVHGRGTATSLRRQLEAAARAWDDARCRPAINGYGAFQNHVDAQSGKAITPRAAGILVANAQYLIDNCTG